MSTKVMIGVTTRQNIINVMPALQLGVDHYVAVETETARNAKWGDGARAVLRAKGVSVSVVPISRDDELNVDAIFNAVSSTIQEQHGDAGELYWNVGGGQKAQQLALWYAHQQMSASSERESWLVYADPARAELTLVRPTSRGFDQKVFPLRGKLAIEDVARCFDPEIFIASAEPLENQEPSRDPLSLLKQLEIGRVFEDALKSACTGAGRGMNARANWNRLEEALEEAVRNAEGCSSSAKSVAAKLAGKTLERPSFQDKLRRMSDSGNIRGDPASAASSLAKEFYRLLSSTAAEQTNGNDKSGRAWEDQVAAKVKDLLDGLDPGRELIADALVRVKFARRDKPETHVGEHDVLLATCTGQLVSLDAKMAMGHNTAIKDIKSRCHELRLVGGDYSRYVLVFPYPLPYKPANDVVSSLLEDRSFGTLVLTSEKEEPTKVVVQDQLGQEYEVETLTSFLSRLCSRLRGPSPRED